MIRSSLITLHKYAGLFLGLLLSVTGISGSILVFDHALDELLTPETANLAESDNPAPLQTVVDAARSSVPFGDPPTRIYLARKPGSAHMVRFPTQAGDPGPTEVSVDPATGEVIAVRTWGEYTATWLYHLHYGYLAGASGEHVVGIVGLVMLFFCISGVVIWWPRSGQWKRAFSIRKNSGAFRLNYDLHKTAGIYLLPVYLVLAFSGVYIVFNSQVTALVDTFLPMEDIPAPLSTPGGGDITVDQAVEVAQARFPDAEVKRVYFPADATGTYRVNLNQTAEPWSSHAATEVWIDQYSGELLAVFDPLATAAGNKVIEWQFPLHNGDALGLFGRWLVFIAGLLPALLFGTGLYMWWRKRRNLVQAAARRPSGQST